MRPLRQGLVLALVLAAVWVLAVAFLAAGQAPKAADAPRTATIAASTRVAVDADARSEAYGENLAWAARWQTWIPVIYDPSYRQIPYPGGDVPWYIGVCTDVLVRAYRRLGVDLQVEVHNAGVGSGDTNIDQRRVDVLRAFFARAGRSLPITHDPHDYKAGDIVSYYVPTGRFSKTHIAIVSDRKATGGTPLIIHNRGVGVQEENRLFAEEITGHYRYWPERATGHASAAK
jgi:uncharacterized protein